jgi:hypothetical protein
MIVWYDQILAEDGQAWAIEPEAPAFHEAYRRNSELAGDCQRRCMSRFGRYRTVLDAQYEARPLTSRLCLPKKPGYLRIKISPQFGCRYPLAARNVIAALLDVGMKLFKKWIRWVLLLHTSSW